MELSHVGMRGKMILVIWHLKQNEQLYKSEKQVNPCVAPVIVFHDGVTLGSATELYSLYKVGKISCKQTSMDKQIHKHIHIQWTIGHFLFN